jgi:tetratricopeptide (TPR) repeat protein
VAISFTEAAMVASPFPWFERRSNEPRGRIAAATAAIEKLLKADPHHPGAIHYYIHLAEMPAPEKAEPYANELASLMPNAGHMVHMPSHIFLRLGRYRDSLSNNLTAVDLDQKFLDAVPEAARAYRFGLFPHNIQMAMASASFAGDGKNALAMAGKMQEALPPTDTKNDLSTGITYPPVLRFGDGLAIPEPKKKMPFAHILWHYARGSAFAWQKNVAAAQGELDALAKERAKYMKKQGKKMGPVPVGVLETAETVLRARLEVAKGDLGAAQGHFETAVTIQERDQLYRGDPPPWDMPAHHYLGVLLMKLGRPDEAASILRQALLDTPNNAWTLYALKEASTKIGDTLAADQYAKLFAKAWASPGVPDLDRL